jgi:hypothetical protein
MPLKEFIDTHFGGNQAAFARLMEVNRQQVTKWLADGWVVVGDILYSPKREIPANGDNIAS